MPSDHGPPPGLTLLTLWLNCSNILPHNPQTFSSSSSSLVSSSSFFTTQAPLSNNNPIQPSLDQFLKQSLDKPLKAHHRTLEDFLCPLLVPSPSPLVSFQSGTTVTFSILPQPNYPNCHNRACLYFIVVIKFTTKSAQIIHITLSIQGSLE